MTASYRDLLSIRPFRDLWLGQAISQFGDALYYLVFLFMVDKLTSNPVLVGITGALQALPFLLFSLPAGVLADRIDRRRIMLIADWCSAALLLVFAVILFFVPHPPILLLIGIGFLLSLVNSFFAPAKSAAIPSLVPTDMLVTANALSQATQSLMPMLGLAVSGGLLGILYKLYPNLFFLLAVALNAVSFLASAWFIQRLPALVPERKEGEVEHAHPMQDLKDGFRYALSVPVLWVLLILGFIIQLSVSPFQIVFVTTNRTWFDGSYQTLALFEFTFFIGLVLGSVYVGRQKITAPGIPYIVSLAFVGLMIVAMAFAKTFFWFCVWNFLAGLALPYCQIPMTTYIQATVPDAYRGRVNSLLTIVSMGVQPLGAGLAGLLIEEIGLKAMFITMGVGLSLAGMGGLLSRPFRTARMPDEENPIPVHSL